MEILIFKLVYTEKVMLFDPFGRELLCFEHLGISLDLTRFEKNFTTATNSSDEAPYAGAKFKPSIFLCVLLSILVSLRCSLFTGIYCR